MTKAAPRKREGWSGGVREKGVYVGVGGGRSRPKGSEVCV